MEIALGPVGSFLLMALVVAGFVVGIGVVLRREQILKRVLVDGVDVTGTVVYQSRESFRNPFYLRYRYKDHKGRNHEHKVQVPRPFWARHPERSRIALVYSKSRPAISGIKYQVEEMRAATKRRAS